MPSHDARPSCKGLSVLVVDDNHYLRDVVRTILELEGAAVAEAASLEEAQAVLQHGFPDAILTDLELRGETHGGLVILEHVKRRPSACAVLLLTGRLEASEEFANAGFDAVLMKPTPTNALIAALLTAIQRSRTLTGKVTTAA